MAVVRCYLPARSPVLSGRIAGLAAAVARRSGEPCIAGIVGGDGGLSPPEQAAFDVIATRHGMQVTAAGKGDVGASDDDTVVIGDWRTHATVMQSATHPPEPGVVLYHSALSSAASTSPALDGLLLHRDITRVFTTGSPVADLSRRAPGRHVDLDWPHDPLPALRRRHTGPLRRIVVTAGLDISADADIHVLEGADPLSTRLSAVRHADGTIVSGKAPNAIALLLEAVAAGTPAIVIGDHPDAAWLPATNPLRRDAADAGAALGSIGDTDIAAAQDALLDRFETTEEDAAAVIVAEGGNDGG